MAPVAGLTLPLGSRGDALGGRSQILRSPSPQQFSSKYKARYVKNHVIGKTLSKVLNQVIHREPADPWTQLAIGMGEFAKDQPQFCGLAASPTLPPLPGQEEQQSEPSILVSVSLKVRGCFVTTVKDQPVARRLFRPVREEPPPEGEEEEEEGPDALDVVNGPVRMAMDGLDVLGVTNWFLTLEQALQEAGVVPGRNPEDPDRPPDSLLLGVLAALFFEAALNASDASPMELCRRIMLKEGGAKPPRESPWLSALTPPPPLEFREDFPAWKKMGHWPWLLYDPGEERGRLPATAKVRLAICVDVFAGEKDPLCELVEPPPKSGEEDEEGDSRESHRDAAEFGETEEERNPREAERKSVPPLNLVRLGRRLSDRVLREVAAAGPTKLNETVAAAAESCAKVCQELGEGAVGFVLLCDYSTAHRLDDYGEEELVFEVEEGSTLQFAELQTFYAELAKASNGYLKLVTDPMHHPRSDEELLEVRNLAFEFQSLGFGIAADMPGAPEERAFVEGIATVCKLSTGAASLFASGCPPSPYGVFRIPGGGGGEAAADGGGEGDYGILCKHVDAALAFPTVTPEFRNFLFFPFVEPEPEEQTDRVPDCPAQARLRELFTGTYVRMRGLGDGGPDGLTLEDWLTGLAKVGWRSPSRTLATEEVLYRVLDLNMNGVISCQELLTLEDCGTSGRSMSDDLDHLRRWLMQRYPEDHAPLATAFGDIDNSGNGKVSFFEFSSKMQEWGYESPSVREVFMCLDLKRTGVIDWEEFSMLHLLGAFYNIERVERCKEWLIGNFGDLMKAYKALDANRSGSLSLGEWSHAVRELGYEQTAGLEDVQEAFFVLDRDGSGILNPREFQELGKYDKRHIRKLVIDFGKQVLRRYGGPDKAFNAFDKNKNGELSCAEFKQMHKELKLESKDDPGLIFNFLDASHGGVVAPGEFAMLTRFQRHTEVLEAREALDHAIIDLKRFARHRHEQGLYSLFREMEELKRPPVEDGE